MCFLNIYY